MTAPSILRHGKKHRAHDRAAAKERERRRRKAADWETLVEVLGPEKAAEVCRSEIWLNIQSGLTPFGPEDMELVLEISRKRLERSRARWSDEGLRFVAAQAPRRSGWLARWFP